MAQLREECAICISEFDTKNYDIKCFNCAIKVCLLCISKYISEAKDFLHCMSCKKQWNILFICQSFDAVWLNNNYVKHREDVIQQRFNAKLPSYQAYIVSIVRKKSYFEEMKKFSKQDLMYIKLSKWHAAEEAFIKGSTMIQPPPREFLEKVSNITDITVILGPCPKDGCRGYITYEHKCGICSLKICPDCSLTITATTHKCLPEDIKSAKMIKKDSKNCPTCRVPIFKVDGCSQMWCTNCKNFFDWNTLTTLVKTIYVHNPHHNAYLLGNHELDYLIMTKSKDTSTRLFFTKLHEISNEVFEITNEEVFCRELAISYLQNKISSSLLKQKLQISYKNMERDIAANSIRLKWTTGIKNSIKDSVSTDLKLDKVISHIRLLETSCKKELDELALIYNSSKIILCKASVDAVFDALELHFLKEQFKTGQSLFSQKKIKIK